MGSKYDIIKAMEGILKEGEGLSSDMQITLYLVSHIEEPCEDEHGNNVRGTYLREAETILATRIFQNPHARKMLENIVREYKK